VKGADVDPRVRYAVGQIRTEHRRAVPGWLLVSVASLLVGLIAFWFAASRMIERATLITADTAEIVDGGP